MNYFEKKIKYEFQSIILTLVKLSCLRDRYWFLKNDKSITKTETFSLNFVMTETEQ